LFHRVDPKDGEVATLTIQWVVVLAPCGNPETTALPALIKTLNHSPFRFSEHSWLGSRGGTVKLAENERAFLL
jgi:hypothetical protein